MKNIVLTFGVIAGVIVSSLMAITVPLSMNGTVDFENGAIFGYSSMILSFLLVFFGIRRYRDSIGGGTVTFGKAFQVGILITLVAAAFYVTTWEIVYWNFFPDFADRYAAISLQNLREDGASAADIAKATEDMAKFKEWYANPLFNIAMTFMEIFPVGLIVTLISAAILRKKDGGTQVPVTA